MAPCPRPSNPALRPSPRFLDRDFYCHPAVSAALSPAGRSPTPHRFLDWDFYCHGHHARCFALPALDYGGLGFVGAQLFPFNNHWGRFHEMTGVINRTAMQRRWQSFFPVGRFSKRFLGMVRECLACERGLLVRAACEGRVEPGMLCAGVWAAGLVLVAGEQRACGRRQASKCLMRCPGGSFTLSKSPRLSTL